MSTRPPGDPRITEILEAELSPDELATLLAVPVGPDEIAEVAALVQWFARRYPTAKERFAYVRSACARWTGSPTRSR